MTGYVLLSEAVCLVAEGLFEGGFQYAEKCRHVDRLIGFSDGDILYPTISNRYISDTELKAVNHTIELLFEWLWSGKLCATYEVDGSLQPNPIGASTWGHFTRNAVRWDLSAIRERRSRKQIEGIKVDPREVRRLLTEHPNIVQASAAFGNGSKQGRPGILGDDALIEELHRRLISGEDSSQRHAVKQIVTSDTPGKSREAAEERIRKKHSRKYPNWLVEAQDARLAREAAAVAASDPLATNSRR